MKQYHTGIIAILMSAIGVVLASESVHGRLAPLSGNAEFDRTGGGDCHTDIANDDNNCPAASSTTACSKAVCTKGTNPNGSNYYECLQNWVQTQEFPGWRSKTNSKQNAGKTQDVSSTFYCNKRQDCLRGKNNCTEVTNDGVISWRCINDGASNLINDHVDHQAGGSNCPRTSG